MSSFLGERSLQPRSGHYPAPRRRVAARLATITAGVLTKLGDRERYVGEDDFVFAGEAGLPRDGDALSSRYLDALERAGYDP